MSASIDRINTITIQIQRLLDSLKPGGDLKKLQADINQVFADQHVSETKTDDRTKVKTILQETFAEMRETTKVVREFYDKSDTLAGFVKVTEKALATAQKEKDDDDIKHYTEDLAKKKSLFEKHQLSRPSDAIDKVVARAKEKGLGVHFMNPSGTYMPALSALMSAKDKKMFLALKELTSDDAKGSLSNFLAEALVTFMLESPKNTIRVLSLLE